MGVIPIVKNIENLFVYAISCQRTENSQQIIDTNINHLAKILALREKIRIKYYITR